MRIRSFFFIDPATTQIYTLSLHDALPILPHGPRRVAALERVLLQRIRRAGAAPHAGAAEAVRRIRQAGGRLTVREDRKSTRLNSSHGYISYAVFCLKKKKKQTYKYNT